MNDHDILVIGHGLAGSLAACLLARSGKVAITNSGTTATALSTGCMTGEMGADDLAWTEHHLLPLLKEGGIAYRGGGHRGITEAGNAHTSLISPRFVNVPTGASISVMDVGPGVWDAGAVARGIAAQGIDVESISFPMKRSPTWGMLARQADGSIEGLRGSMAEAGNDVVLIPPLFGLPRPDEGMRYLEGCGRMVREAVVPLALPGRRLQEALSRSVSSRCTVLEGRRVMALRREGDSINAAVLKDGKRQRTITFSTLVLASGGLVGGGLEPRGIDLRESMGMFGVDGKGLQVQEGIPLFRDGRRCRNAVVAGSILPGIGYGDGGGLLEVAASVRRCLEAMP